MSVEKFDLVVLGSGPAGEKGAAAAAYFGKKVALIEKENVLGGAAANTGTLPSKTLRESALYLSGFKQRKLFGFQVDMMKNIHISDLWRMNALLPIMNASAFAKISPGMVLLYSVACLLLVIRKLYL